jgi:hypothetical protein
MQTQNTSNAPIAWAIVAVGVLGAALFLFMNFAPEILASTVPPSPTGWQCLAPVSGSGYGTVAPAYPTDQAQVWRLEHGNPTFTCTPKQPPAPTPPTPSAIASSANTLATKLDTAATHLTAIDASGWLNDAIDAERQLIAQTEVDKTPQGQKIATVLPQVTDAINAKDAMAMNRAAVQLRTAAVA